MARRQMIAVIGAGQCDKEIYAIAQAVGRHIAKRGHIVLTGGLGGVMEAALKGAKEVGGLTVGILPTSEKSSANLYVDIPIPTEMGHARNVILCHTADALVAVAGGFGTLSEIAIALKLGKRVVGIRTWEIRGVETARDPEEAARLVLKP